MSSSGLILKIEAKGSAKIIYEDYGVEELGNADYEVTYSFNQINFSKLLNSINCKNYDDAEEYIKKVFGVNLEKISISKYCNENEIKYDKNVWCD